MLSKQEILQNAPNVVYVVNVPVLLVSIDLQRFNLFQLVHKMKLYWQPIIFFFAKEKKTQCTYWKLKILVHALRVYTIGLQPHNKCLAAFPGSADG